MLDKVCGISEIRMVPRSKSFPMSCVRVLLKNQRIPLITYDIIDTDPEGKKAVVTAPLSTGGLGCEILVKERDLVHDRPIGRF